MIKLTLIPHTLTVIISGLGVVSILVLIAQLKLFNGGLVELAMA